MINIKISKEQKQKIEELADAACKEIANKKIVESQKRDNYTNDSERIITHIKEGCGLYEIEQRNISSENKSVIRQLSESIKSGNVSKVEEMISKLKG